MTNIHESEDIPKWMGWCPMTATMRSASTILTTPPVMVNPLEPDGGGRGTGRIGRGIGIATGSLRALVRDRQMLWFAFFSGLVMLFLIAVEGWTVANIQSSPPFLIDIPGNFFISYPYLDTRLFLIELICLSCFTLVLAGLILHRNGNSGKKPATIRESFTGINGQTGSLLALSLGLAVLATLVFMIASQSPFIGSIVHAVTMTLFWLPYAYYFSNDLFGGLYFASELMFINAILLLITLYVVPVIVLEKKGLVPAIAGAAIHMKRTWCEMLGCLLVIVAIVLGVAAVALLIGQSPLLLNHDYDFFLSFSRGRMLMMVVCYGFFVASWILMAVGSTAAGVAIADLYAYGKTGRMPGEFTEN
ncbi:MAG: hypothetical protein Q7T80_16290 [Methanoregula sp.]|nr:hypothetical protein [Methanoregula sp.]